MARASWAVCFTSPRRFLGGVLPQALRGSLGLAGDLIRLLSCNLQRVTEPLANGTLVYGRHLRGSSVRWWLSATLASKE
jgi:hypothetical protein